MSTSRRRRRPALVLQLAAVVGLVAAAAACNRSGDATASTTTLTPATTRLVVRNGAMEAWCKKMTDLPASLPSLNSMVASRSWQEFDKVTNALKQLRDSAPAEVKPDFDTLIAFTEAFTTDAKAGTLGTTQEDLARWATAKFGPDAVSKFKDALDHILTVQANNC